MSAGCGRFHSGAWCAARPSAEPSAGTRAQSRPLTKPGLPLHSEERLWKRLFSSRDKHHRDLPTSGLRARGGGGGFPGAGPSERRRSHGTAVPLKGHVCLCAVRAAAGRHFPVRERCRRPRPRRRASTRPQAARRARGDRREPSGGAGGTGPPGALTPLSRANEGLGCDQRPPRDTAGPVGLPLPPRGRGTGGGARGSGASSMGGPPPFGEPAPVRVLLHPGTHP